MMNEIWLILWALSASDADLITAMVMRGFDSEQACQETVLEMQGAQERGEPPFKAGGNDHFYCARLTDLPMIRDGQL